MFLQTNSAIGCLTLSHLLVSTDSAPHATYLRLPTLPVKHTLPLAIPAVLKVVLTDALFDNRVGHPYLRLFGIFPSSIWERGPESNRLERLMRPLRSHSSTPPPWGQGWDSNPQHPDYKSGVLPIETTPAKNPHNQKPSAWASASCEQGTVSNATQPMYDQRPPR